jgi:hypothetical protein
MKYCDKISFKQLSIEIEELMLENYRDRIVMWKILIKEELLPRNCC